MKMLKGMGKVFNMISLIKMEDTDLFHKIRSNNYLCRLQGVVADCPRNNFLNLSSGSRDTRAMSDSPCLLLVCGWSASLDLRVELKLSTFFSKHSSKCIYTLQKLLIGF